MRERLQEKKRTGTFANMNKLLLVLTIILIIIGTLSIVSASANESISRYGQGIYYYFFRHIAMIVIACILAFVIHRLPTKIYKKLIIVLWFTVLGLLFALFLYGKVKRGAVNWLPVFGIKVQPSEFAKPIIIVALAIFFEKTVSLMQKGKVDWKFLLYGWIIIGIIIPIIIIAQGDVGTAGIIASISVLMFLASPLEGKLKTSLVTKGFILLSILFIALFLGGFRLSQEKTERLTEFFNPCSRYEDSGYQICNCFIAINSGGFNGLGIGKSQQKYSYIPEAYTDSIFAIIVEESGLKLGLPILLIYLIMIREIIKISRNAITYRGRYICYGVAVYFFMHILLNIGGLLGLLPLTGVPLPLITYGGSFTISFLCSIALVQRVNIENNLRKYRSERITEKA